MSMEFLTSSDQFMTRLTADFARAEHRALVQAMTFEGDAAGERCAAAIKASPASDRRLIFDAYSLLVVSDRWLIEPQHTKTVLRERAETLTMMHRLESEGVGVRMVHPLGAAGRHLPLRNHKKLVVADDALYLGGINFSDHNFAWRDMMVRLNNGALADWLVQDLSLIHI